MSDDGTVVDLLNVEDSVYADCLVGHPVRRIARKHHLTVNAVEQIIAARVPVIDRAFRLRMLQLDIERLDELSQVFHAEARDGNVQAAAILLKVQERRASLLGLGPMHIDPVQLQDDVSPSPNSTAQLLSMLDAIAAEARPAEPPAPTPAPSLRLIAPDPDPESVDSWSTSDPDEPSAA